MRRATQTVSAPATPLYLRGYGSPAPRLRRMRQSVSASSTPIYLQGWTLGAGASAVGAGVSVASSLPGAIASGSWAGPIGAGIGVVVGLISGLLGAHALRAKQAKNENSAVNIGVSGFDSDLKQIWSAYKAGQISEADAVNAIQQTLLQGYWTVVSPQIQPGRNGCQSGSACPAYNPPANMCQGNIGAACCIGCANLVPSLNGTNGVFAALAGQSGSKDGPYVAEISTIGASKYGTSARAGYTLDFSPPAASAASSSISSLANAITGGAGGSSLLPILLIGAVAFLALR